MSLVYIYIQIIYGLSSVFFLVIGFFLKKKILRNKDFFRNSFYQFKLFGVDFLEITLTRNSLRIVYNFCNKTLTIFILLGMLLLSRVITFLFSK